MALDPSIALGVRPLQLPDPLAQMAQVSQIQAGQQQQQLNKMKIEELIADKQELNDFAAKIKDTGLTPRDYLKMLSASRNPERQKMGMEGLMRLDEQDKYGEVLKKIYPKLYEGSAETPAAAPAAAPSAMGALRPTAAAPTNALAPAFGPTPGAPVNALVNQQNTPERLEMNIAALAPFASRPGVKEQIAGFQTQLAELRKPIVASAGSTIYGPSGQIIANVPAQPTELQRNYEYAKNQGFKGNIFDYEREIKLASRAPIQPVQPVAPTITQIVDPANPNQMITIDARRYQGGGAGSPGVIGVAGKEPSAALRINKAEQGKTQLADDLDNLRASFQTLDQMRSIPSTERGALSNVASGVASTGLGQKAGQLFGTEAQVERDVINSARSRLVNSIKNATGMSAQQLNSNVELQTMLKSISDPGQSYQSAIRIIDDIEKAYVTGGGMLPKRGQPAAAPAATQGTGGFKYLGKESNK
jgi:hypothetical protein